MFHIENDYFIKKQDFVERQNPVFLYFELNNRQVAQKNINNTIYFVIYILTYYNYMHIMYTWNGFHETD
jgi:hypothetical protein